MKLTTVKNVEIEIDDRVISKSSIALKPQFELGQRVSFMAVCHEGKPYSIQSPTPAPDAVKCFGYVSRCWTNDQYVCYALTLDDGSHLGLFMYEDMLSRS